MYENQMIVKQQAAALGCAMQDPMQQMTCGENLERKIAEQKER